MRFNARDINTSIRIEAGGTRGDRFVTACLQRLYAKVSGEFSATDSSVTAPQARRAGTYPPRFARASARAEEASRENGRIKLPDSAFAGFQAASV